MCHLDCCWLNAEVTPGPDENPPGLDRNYQPLEKVPGKKPTHKPIRNKAAEIRLTTTGQPEKPSNLRSVEIQEFTDHRVTLDKHGGSLVEPGAGWIGVEQGDVRAATDIESFYREGNRNCEQNVAGFFIKVRQ
jgi:hypothetical protein